MDDLISRHAAIKVADAIWSVTGDKNVAKVWDQLKDLPSAQPTIYGYNVEHLELIARILREENVPPERVVDVLTDIGGIVSIIRDEFEEALRKAVEQCTI